jgi:hypothetical protein
VIATRRPKADSVVGGPAPRRTTATSHYEVPPRMSPEGSFQRWPSHETPAPSQEDAPGVAKGTSSDSKARDMG